MNARDGEAYPLSGRPPGYRSTSRGDDLASLIVAYPNTEPVQLASDDAVVVAQKSLRRKAAPLN